MTAAAIHIAADGTAEVAFEFCFSAVDELKARIPYHAREWHPDRKVWTIASGPFIGVAISIMQDIFGANSMYIQDDRAGRRPANGAPTLDTAYRTLHLQPTAPPHLIQAAYKTLSLMHHPDRGGDTAAMQSINSAMDSLRDQLASRN